MKKSRIGSPAGEALASPSVATVQLPLPLLDVLADTRTAFFGLCLDAGQQVLRTLMEQERARLCGPKNVPDPDRRAYRGGSVRGEVTLGGRRIAVPRPRRRGSGPPSCPSRAYLVTPEYWANGKPDPKPFLRSAERLGVDPATCVVLEDAPSGVESG